MRGLYHSVYTASHQYCRLLAWPYAKLTRGVHLVKELDPQYPLPAVCAFVAADINNARDLLEIWPCRRRDACGEGILGEE
jgi:hypothetical protein